MSHVTGTATGFMDLLDLLDAFLCDAGHAWGKTYEGTGDGTLTEYQGKAASVAETITIEATSATSFDVTGTVSGAIGTATVGTPFTSTEIDFLLTAGGVAFIAGDTFTINTTPNWERLRYAGTIGAAYRTGINWSAVSTNTFDKAFDDTTLHARSTSVPCSLSIEMYVAEEVTNFNLSCGDSTTVTPKDITLEYSDDGSAWTDTQTWTGLTWTTVQELKQFTVTSAPGAHKHWRLTFENAQSGQTTVRVTELEFFSSPSHNWELDSRFEFAWRAPGLDDTKNIYIGGYVYEDQTLNIHNLVFEGFRFWNPNNRVSTQGSSSGTKVLPLNDQPMTYHFVANGQRVIVAAMPSASYESAYLGFCFPYETPSTHPYPHVIGACGDDEDLALSETTTVHRAFWNPGEYGIAAYYPNNTWQQHANRTTVSSSDGNGNTTDGKIYPWATTAGGSMLTYMRDQIDGDFTLIPGVISIDESGVSHTCGEFDGVYYVTGFNNSPGTLIEQDGFEHLVIKNITRTGVQDFAAIRLD